jgi:hypothetical protein
LCSTFASSRVFSKISSAIMIMILLLSHPRDR